MLFQKGPLLHSGTVIGRVPSTHIHWLLKLFRLSLEEGPLLHTVFLLIQEGSPNTNLEYPE